MEYKIVVADSIEKIWATLFDRVKNEGEEVGNTIELLDQHFILTNMKNSLMFFPGQNIYLPFLITDFHDLLSPQDPNWTLKWHPSSKEFCDKNGKFLGRYGERIRQNNGDQLLWCFKELQRNPDSRQAIIMYYYPAIDQNQPYPPCTVSQQFMIRNGELHTFVTMRSNDLLSGALYDWQARSLLAEHLANWLEVPTGNYYHSNQSSHLYSGYQEIDLTEKLPDSRRKIPKVGPVTYDETAEDLYNFDTILHDIEDGFFGTYEYTNFHSNLWAVWAKVISVFGAYHAKKYDISIEILAKIVNTRYFDQTALYLLRSIKKNLGTIKDYEFVKADIGFSKKFIDSFINK